MSKKDQLQVFYDDLRHGLSVLWDLIILNLLFILCSIPVITVGAAGVACYSGILRLLHGDRAGVSIARFFRDFASGFKKATLAWLLELVCLLILAGDYWFATVYSEPANTFFMIFAIVLAAAVILAAVWLYPLIARFENKLGAHIKNSFLMLLARFPRTLLALLMQAAFLLIPFIIFNAFVVLGWFWLLFGASLPMYLTAKLFGKALQLAPTKPDTDEQIKDQPSE